MTLPSGGSDGYQVKAGTGFRRAVRRRRDNKKKTQNTTTTKPSIAAAYGKVTQDYDGAKRLVQSQGKGYILLVFSGSDWCGWCQVMDRNVFKQKGWEKSSRGMNVVSVLIDTPRNKSLVPAKWLSLIHI